MTIASLAPTATIFLTARSVSSQVALPTTGTPTVALVSNTGDQVAFVQLGASASVTATIQGSTPVMPGEQLALTIGTNTNMAAITLSHQVGINITVGN